MDTITTTRRKETIIRYGHSAAVRAAAVRCRVWVLGLRTAIAEGLSRAALNRSVVRQLSVMSDRELKDIGLIRQDVWDSEMLLLEGDSSSFLIGRREERRQGRGRISVETRSPHDR